MATDEDQVREKHELDEWRADPSHWKGIFYFNKDDKAIVVPGRLGLSYTLNFARPASYLLLLVILAPIIALALFAR